MTGITISRRNLLRATGCILAGRVRLLCAATALAGKQGAIASKQPPTMTREQVIRSYYSGWEKKDWSAIDSLLADGFTFTSPNHDDHLDKRTFKTRCWSQADFIQHFEFESLISKDDDAFVKYLCHTKNSKSFRNTEYFRFKAGRIEAIEVYFGGDLGFPSAASLGER